MRTVMNSKFLSKSIPPAIAAVLIMISLTTFSQNSSVSKDLTWGFETNGPFGLPPVGWKNGWSIGTPPPFRYQATNFMGRDVMFFETLANTNMAAYIQSDITTQEGVYEWCFFVPMFETGAQVGATGFLSGGQQNGSLDAREIDAFEMGFGSMVDRASVANLPSDSPLLYMTVQRDLPSGTLFSSEIFRPKDPSNHIQPTNWYTIAISLFTNQAGQYVVNWYVQKEGGPILRGRPPHTCGFGPNNAYPTDFRIISGPFSPNTGFLGDHTPTQDHQFHYDHVRHVVGPQLITHIEHDVVSLGDGAWGGVGPSLSALSINTNVNDAFVGSKSIRVSADWGAGSSVEVDYTIPSNTLDAVAGAPLHWWMKADDQNPLVSVTFQEADGDLWKSTNSYAATTNYASYSVALSPLNFTLASTGSLSAGYFDVNSISNIGFRISANGATNGTSIFHFDEISWNEAIPPRPSQATEPSTNLPTILVTSMESDTTSDVPLWTGPPNIWFPWENAYVPGSLQVVNNGGSNSTEGAKHLEITFDWSVMNRGGCYVNLPAAPQDWSSYSSITFDIKVDQLDPETTCRFTLIDADNDCWTTIFGNVPTEEYQSLNTELRDGARGLNEVCGGGDGGNRVLNLQQVKRIGMNFENLSHVGTQTFSIDYIRIEDQTNHPDFGDWQRTRFTSIERNSAAADPLADPESDYNLNLMEYAMGTDPHHPNNPPLVSIEARNDNAEVSVRRWAKRADINYGFEGTSNILDSFSWLTTAVHMVTNTPSLLIGRYTLSASNAPTGNIRLKVKQIESNDL